MYSRTIPCALALLLPPSLSLAQSGAPAEPAPALSPLEQAEHAIRYFHEVSPGKVYRGSVPTEEGFKALRDLGIRTDISLLLPHEIHSAVIRERELADKYGITFIHRPMVGGWEKIARSEVDNVLRIMDDPSYYPFYVHCKYGWDRTGMVIGLYRVFDERSMTPKQAWQEMKRLKFHWYLWKGLSCTFKQMAGMHTIGCSLFTTYDPVLSDPPFYGPEHVIERQAKFE